MHTSTLGPTHRPPHSSPTPLPRVGVTWGEDVILGEGDGRGSPTLGMASVLATGLYNPWASEEEFNDHLSAQVVAWNEEDCDRAEDLHSLNPPLQDWLERWVEAETSLSARPPSPPSSPRPPDTYFQLDAGLTQPGGLRCTRVIHAVEKNPDLLPRPEVPAGGSGAEAAKLRRVMQRAERLGLLGDIAGENVIQGQETALSRQLRAGMLQRARETYDVGRLWTALEWFEEFMRDARRDPTFVPLQHEGDLAAMRYNQETLDMFAEYIRLRGSRATGHRGETLKSDSVSAYVAQIKKLRTHEAHHAIVAPSVNVIAPAAHKRMRQADGPPGERRLSLGVRAQMLKLAASTGFPRMGARAVIEWAAALLAHNLLCRGGEVCVRDGEALDPERDLTLGALEFREPGEVSEGLPWLTAEFVPIKDTTARRRSTPLPVRRRKAGGALGEDPMDTYDAIVLAVRQRIGRMPGKGRITGPEASLPLFTGPSGRPWRTEDTRRLARRIAAHLGMDEAQYGGKSFRIGGATDLRSVYGPDAAMAMIKQRGRWASDIHTVYQRALASEHLGASAAIGDASGEELEALCTGWAQPAGP